MQIAEEHYITSDSWLKNYVLSDRVRAARAIELLECIGNADGRAILRDLANGNPLAVQTQHAREALERIEKCRDGGR